MSLVSAFYNDADKSSQQVQKARPLKRKRTTDSTSVTFTLPIHKILKSVNTDIYEDEPVLKKSRFDHFEKTESLKDILPKPKNQVLTDNIPKILEDDFNDVEEEDDHVDIIPKEAKLDNYFDDGIVEKKKGNVNLESLVDESLKDILNGVEDVKEEVGSKGEDVENKNLLDKKVDSKGDNKKENNKVIPKVDDVLKSIPVKQTMVGPRIPLEIRKRQASDLLNKNKIEEMNNVQELQNNNVNSNVYNPDFVREWERMNPGNKFEQVELSGEANIIDVNAYNLRIQNWEMFNQHQQQKETFKKGIVSNRWAPVTKQARKNGHISSLLKQADTQEHELHDLWNTGKNQRNHTRSKYGW
jgi:hypothetical protein